MNVIDWGYLGVLLMFNKGVVEVGIKVVMVLYVEIEYYMYFDWKNYFYLDNLKVY